MPIDSRNKRFSMMGLGQPVPSVLPDPDGSIDQQDRAMLLFLYHGIELAKPNNVVTFGVLSFMSQYGVSLEAVISIAGQSSAGTISQSMGILSKIDDKGESLSATISDKGVSIEDKL